MKKPVYKLLDEKGRILIPKEFRQMAELESGDIVKLSVSSGKIMVSKVDIRQTEQGDTESGRAAGRAGAGNRGRDSRKYDEHGNVRRISERI